MMTLSYQKGLSLIEAAVFIVIVAVTASALMLPLTLMQQTPEQYQLQRATELAKQRMEVWVQKRRLDGFNSAVSDPCSSSGSGICQVPGGYTVTTQVSNWQNNNNIKKLTVTVSGDGNASVSTLIADYDD